MKLSALFFRLFTFIVWPSAIFTVLLYLYPPLHGCEFPAPVRQKQEACLVDEKSSRTAYKKEVAPFRLLALGDPQLEGDSSLPNIKSGLFPSLRKPFEANTTSDFLIAIRDAPRDLFAKDIWRLLRWTRKRVDLWGNDYYLAHIYRTLRWWLEPTHVTVLGDLLGSQWISDSEFEWRSWRFWNRAFKGGRRVEDGLMDARQEESLGWDQDWSRRIINVAGNHDIGYAGDIDSNRLDRFEREFGRANWDIKFRLPTNNSATLLGGPPELRIIVLNSMNLDGPARDFELQMQTFNFINQHVMPASRPVEDRRSGNVILTHIPLYKDEGVCVDGPHFDFGAHGIREQNHLSRHASSAILKAILGMSPDPGAPAAGRGRKGVVLTGHDHEGCDVYHHIPADREEDDEPWRQQRWHLSEDLAASGIPGVREITVRSMMGSYGGNAGMLSAWFDWDIGEWQFEYRACRLGVQHIWWAVHVLDLITVVAFVASVIALVMEQYHTSDHGKEGHQVSKKVAVPNGFHKESMESATGRDSGSASKRTTTPKKR